MSSSFNEKILNAVSNIATATGTSNPFAGKWVSILGDSISTYKGYNPDGQAYTEQADLTDVRYTWWGYLLNKLGAKLCVNNSQNGISCCGGQGAVGLDRHKALHREAGTEYINLDGSKSTFDEVINPDIILVFLGHNDYNAGNKGFGEYDLITPRASDYKDTSNVCNAFESLMIGLTYAYPDATVYVMNPIYVGGADKSKWPLSSNTLKDTTDSGYWTQPRLADMIRTMTLKYGIHYIETNRIGLLPTEDHSGTDKFSYSGYSHPTAAGHRIIAAKVYSSMMSDYAGWATRNDI